MKDVDKILQSRRNLGRNQDSNKTADEGGCGVVGCASSVLILGKHFLTALDQMKNRGNGKGGGVALLGLDPKEWGITEEILQTHYIYQIAVMDSSIIHKLEDKYIDTNFSVSHSQQIETGDHEKLDLDVKPPDVHQYFVTIKEKVLNEFIEKTGIESRQKAKDEFIYQTTFKLNQEYYASHGEKQAFVLSHAKNLLVFKIVGFADQVIRYYNLNDIKAHVWIGHHRYPTKGTVWHPGGAHPFIGLNEALVHNGDFSNYHAVSEYLAQRNIFPQFLTDTEVAALQFDLYSRVYEYPTEYLIEAIAPTTERDFWMLSEEKRDIYAKIQQSHLHGSPDGPWFFIIGRSMSPNHIQLLGITDTSMLRPQVFAMFENEDVSIGLIGSERQAIDATLRSLSMEDNRFSSKADIYWNARGGSYTDGGAFIFDVQLSDKPRLMCSDKFGNVISSLYDSDGLTLDMVLEKIPQKYHSLLSKIGSWDDFEDYLTQYANSAETRNEVINCITAMLDRWHLLPVSKDGTKRGLVENTLNQVFRSYPKIDEARDEGVLINNSTRNLLRQPKANEKFLVIDISEFAVEGPESAANFIVDAYKLGWSHVYTFDWRGHRFCGCGLGAGSDGFRIDVYGNPGDYLGSGLDGAEIFVHCSAQDQVGQMMKSGKLVIYGDVGQTFLYGAKGGEIYVLGNAAGRPLINAVGSPKLIINGTCLDYLAESFMAGNPLEDGGFAILNGLRFDEMGEIKQLEIPYAGGNLFSLASGGAIYVNDPNRQIRDNQLHGGEIVDLSELDWNVIEPYLRENSNLFYLDYIGGNGKNDESYIKIQPSSIKELKSH